MITIKIKNAHKIVEREKNWLIAKVAPHFIDVQQKVDETIADEIKKTLRQRGIDAEVEIVPEE